MDVETAVAIAEMLEMVEDHEFVQWLFTPQPLLDGEAPAQRILDGDAGSVVAVIDQLASGAYA